MVFLSAMLVLATVQVEQGARLHYIDFGIICTYSPMSVQRLIDEVPAQRLKPGQLDKLATHLRPTTKPAHINDPRLLILLPDRSKFIVDWQGNAAHKGRSWRMTPRDFLDLSIALEEVTGRHLRRSAIVVSKPSQPYYQALSFRTAGESSSADLRRLSKYYFTDFPEPYLETTGNHRPFDVKRVRLRMVLKDRREYLVDHWGTLRHKGKTFELTPHAMLMVESVADEVRAGRQ